MNEIHIKELAELEKNPYKLLQTTTLFKDLKKGSCFTIFYFNINSYSLYNIIAVSPRVAFCLGIKLPLEPLITPL